MSRWVYILSLWYVLVKKGVGQAKSRHTMQILETRLNFLRTHLSRGIFTISTANLNRLINDYLQNNGLSEARRLFDQNPTSRNTSTWNTMIGAYVKRHQIKEAFELFDQMPERDIVSWNTILMSLKKTKDPEMVSRYFVEMLRYGMNPTEYTIPMVIDAVLDSAHKVLVRQIHAIAVRTGLNLSACVGSALIKGYTSVKHQVALKRVFDDILYSDVASWNALVSGYMRLGSVFEGKRVFDGMPEKDVVSWTTMLIGYISNRRIRGARILFNQMSEKNVVSWTAMISGYVQCGEFSASLMLFHSMVESGYKPNHYTFSCVLDACAGCSSLLMGKQVHSSITKYGINCDVIISTSLVDMYAKSGDIDAASCVFKSMPSKNLVSWNSMIGGFARHGLGSNALEEFEKMIKIGFDPDQVTYINLLSACAHAGLVEEGEKHFKSMGKYGLRAGKEHYASMVDLYGRAGKLDKAEKLIMGMPFAPDLVILGALLGACGLHSCLELGEIAAEGISKLKSNHPAAYEILSRIHGEKGMWSSVMKLRMRMKRKNVRKQNAGSWVEAPSNVE